MTPGFCSNDSVILEISLHYYGFSDLDDDFFCNGKTPNVSSSPRRLSDSSRVVEWWTSVSQSRCMYGHVCRCVIFAVIKTSVAQKKKSLMITCRSNDKDMGRNNKYDFHAFKRTHVDSFQILNNTFSFL